MAKQRRFLSKRSIQIALGILWLIDGVLQLQPQMYTSNFASQVIAPAAQGQPWFVSNAMHLGIHIFLTNPALFNTLFVTIQLSLGLFILRKQTAKMGLILSIIWGLLVWVFGEGCGGIFSGQTTILMGAPGAALLYALLALAILPHNNKSSQKQDSTQQQPAYWLVIVWFILWAGGAIYQLLPGQNSASGISSMILGNASGAPSWLASIDTHVAKFISNLTSTTSSNSMNMHVMQSSGYWLILAFSLVMLFVGIGIFVPGLVRKYSITLGIILSLIFWIVGQSLGGYYTGTATDPNTAPLYILLAFAILKCTSLDKELSKLGHKIEAIIIGPA